MQGYMAASRVHSPFGMIFVTPELRSLHVSTDFC